MSNLNTVNNSLNTAMQSSTSSGSSELSSADFLKLMITQLRNQDPTAPADSDQIFTQMAQMGTVSGLAQLQDSFSTLSQSLTSNQALSAVDMVGHKVMVSSSMGVLTSTPSFEAAVNVPSGAGALTVQISDSNGNLLRTMSLGTKSTGMNNFTWDGYDDDGKLMPPGTYQMKVQAQVGSASQALPTYAIDVVDSVSINGNGQPPTLNLDGLGAVSLSNVSQVI